MNIDQIIHDSGWLWTFLTVYLGGLAMNLTPCVYPMIPITISYFGGTAGESTRLQGFMRAVLFVIGMAITYSALGVSAALGGKIFGASMGNPYVIAFVSGVMVLMALSMFGVFQMTAPSGWLSGIQHMRDRLGWLGALFFGLVIGVVMAPCVGPFITSLLVYVAGKGDPQLGFLLFFTLAVGMGTPYLVLGYFTSALKSLPRAGTWMIWLERFFGLVLIGYAFRLWRPFIPSEALADAILAAYVLIAAGYLAVAGRSPKDKAGFRAVRAVVSIAGLACGGYLAWQAFHEGTPVVTPPPAAGASGAPITPSAVAWQPYSDEALKKAQAEGRPVMIDFYAKWCAACNELDEKTYSDPRVIAASQKVLFLKADFTKVPDVESDPAAKRFKIQGLPTVVFIGADGKPLDALRIEEFVPADKMLDLLQKALAARR